MHHPDLLFMTPTCPESPSFYKSPRRKSESKILCTGPLRGYLVSSRLPPLPGQQFLLIFTAKCYALLFLALMHWVGSPMVRLRPHAPQRESLQLRYPSGFSATTCGCSGQHSVCLHPSYQSLCGFSCKSLAIICLFSCPSVGYQVDCPII